MDTYKLHGDVYVIACPCGRGAPFVSHGFDRAAVIQDGIAAFQEEDKCTLLEVRISTLEAELKDREWISCEDRIPDHMNEVVVCYNNGIALAKYWETTGMWISNNSNVHCGDLVTHWMPLPSPPKEKEQ